MSQSLAMDDMAYLEWIPQRTSWPRNYATLSRRAQLEVMADRPSLNGDSHHGKSHFTTPSIERNGRTLECVGDQRHSLLSDYLASSGTFLSPN